MPVSNCNHHDTCVDCVLARDPYCAWDLATKQCSSVRSVSNTSLQSLKEEDSTQCPQPGTPLTTTFSKNCTFKIHKKKLCFVGFLQLLCKAHTNLAQLHWRHSGQILRPDDKHYFSDCGHLIVGASTSDAGLYICDSVEKTTGRVSNKTVASYQLQLSPAGTTNYRNFAVSWHSD